MLGPIELWAGDIRHDLGSRKERCALAVLLWEPGRHVPAETLVSRIWGDEPPESAHKSLHENLSRLRRRLRAAGGTGQELSRRLGSYTLDVSRRDVDTWRFRTLRDQARAAAAGGDDELAVTLYGEAEALWHGSPLDGLDGDWAESIRARLNEERLRAAVQRIRSELNLHRHADLVGEIADLIHQHPLDETLVELYLLALYGSGRKSEALNAYFQAERRWRSDFGVGLGTALRQIHQMMLRDDAGLAARSASNGGHGRAAAPDAVRPPTLPSAMPRDNPDFTGRAAELKMLSSWLGTDPAQPTGPVIVISGMTGVGKSALAAHAAHLLRDRYPDQLYLSLHGHDPKEAPLEPTAALGTLLRKLNVPDSVIPAEAEDRAALWQFKLAGRKTLILLDDALDAEQVVSLLPDARDCLVLVTARRRMLALPGIHSLALAPLPHADAAELFTRAADAAIARSDDRAAIARVVRLCGYLPQEIQVAGRRLRGHPAWSVYDLASRLRDSRSVGSGMTSALDLSYQYLPADQQRLFRWLALHPGDSFSIHAAAAMIGDASAAVTEHALETLLDYHLIEEPVPGRYAFHNLVREYATDLAEPEPKTESDRRLAMGRLLHYYVCLADQADQVAHPFRRRISVPRVAITRPALPLLRTRSECMARLETDKASLLGIARYAAAEGWPSQAGLLAHLLGAFLDTWGEWTDAIGLHRRAVAAWRTTGNTAGEATALTDLAFILCRTGQHAEAAQCAREALAAARSASDSGCEAAALDTMGVIFSVSARYAEALACHDQAIPIWREVGDRHGEADALNRSGMPAAHLGKHTDALRRAELAHAIYRELGDLIGEAKALNNLGGMHQDAHRYDEALPSYEQAMATLREIGDRQGEAIALSNIGDIRQISGDHEEALRDYRTALDIFHDIGDRRSEAETLNGMAAAFTGTRNNQAAVHHYERALVLASELAERHTQAVSYLGMGEVHLMTGQFHSAADDYRIALKLSRKIADPVQEGHALYGLGRALETQGATEARDYLQSALAILETVDDPRADDIRARLERSVPGLVD
jgi:tetratricopeptide (TPR) repeat protein/DNA-binding SARP family transcriptional activator